MNAIPSTQRMRQHAPGSVELNQPAAVEVQEDRWECASVGKLLRVAQYVRNPARHCAAVPTAPMSRLGVHLSKLGSELRRSRACCDVQRAIDPLQPRAYVRHLRFSAGHVDAAAHGIMLDRASYESVEWPRPIRQA